MTTRRPAPGATYLAVLILLLAAAAPTRCRSNAADDVIAASFVGDTRRSFEHLARDPDTGALYVGAVNALYRLDANLTRREAATTGPRDDDVGCSLGRPCATGVPTDNHNKVLVVDVTRGRLVVCGSVAHGVCDVRPLAAISSVARAAPTTPVAANNASAPTVAFLAPGPRGRSVLVVGATVATHDGGAAAAPTTSAYWDSVKAVASRTLDDGDPATSDLFRFVAKDAVSSLGTFVGFRSGTGSHRLTYPILYRSGFSAGGFSYLTTVQRATLDPGAPYVSKVARVCEADVEYRSFSEARLVCAAPPGDDAGGDYDVLQAATSGRIGRDLAADLGLTPQDEVLVGVFARARSDDGGGAPSWEPSGDSALCLYRLLDVERTFATNERKCRDGYGSSIYWTGTMQDCVKTKVTTTSLCETEFMFLNGTDAIVATALRTYSATYLTAVALSSVHNNTVAYVGTRTGHVKKLALDSGEKATEYAEVPVDEGSRVNSDLIIDAANEYLYVMTEHKLSKLRVETCEQYADCGQCVGSGDAHCGWCYSDINPRCTPRRECNTDWVYYRTGDCMLIKDVLPHSLQVTKKKTLTIHVENLRAHTAELQCVFYAGATYVLTAANRTAVDTIQCSTPDTRRLKAIPIPPVGREFYVSKLSVRVGEATTDITFTNFTFFDCSQYNSCMGCTDNEFGCTWCTSLGQCTHNPDNYCEDRSDNMHAHSSTASGQHRGPADCPRITVAPDDAQFLVPSGERLRIAVTAVNVLSSLMSEFHCRFRVSGRSMLTAAQYNATSRVVTCNKQLFEYSSSEQRIEVPLDVVWGPKSRPLDNTANIKVSVYKCETMGRQCGECLRTDAMYACGWCGGATCSTEKQCRPADWFSLSNDTICPNPTITSFSPTSGPIEGGTVVVIDGYNLGLAFDDVDPYVTVGASACDCGAHRDAYVPARRVVCTVGRSRGGVTRGHVRVAVRGDSRHVAESREQYAYVDPEVATVRPRRGPMSGGTTLTVEGRHLDAGSRVAVTLGGAAIGDAAGGVADTTGGAGVSQGGAGSACEVVARNATHVVCVTAAAEVAGAATLTVTLDGASRGGGGGGGGEELAFVYTDDPVVNATESAVSGRQPGGVPSGGLEVFVRGENLDVVQHPQLLVVIGDEEYSHPCVVANDTMMTCKTPTFPQSKAPSGDKPRAVDYGFIMDGVTSLRNLSAVQFGKFHLYPDPVVHNFSEDGRIKLYKTDYLAISIDNACEICNRADFFEVRIGRRVCNVTSVAPNLINCVPPGEQPEPVAPPVGATRRDKRKHLPEVIVIVGGTRRYVIGYLEYDTERPVLPLWAAAAISGVGLALIVAIVVVVVKYCRKKRESKKVVRGMQQQMDQLELKVAAECKEAFAELQTDMPFLTDEVSGYQIPFHDYRTHTLKVLFPSELDYAVLHELEVDDESRRAGVQRALRQFGQLVDNRTFLLTFVRTLEANKYFTMKDRVSFASFLMVALQGKMEYCTEILKTLLSELIEKSIQGKCHPKLLLRRTESVAEKMLSAWFTFLLYRLLQESVGDPLYKLCMAVQQQIDKGPVDAVTAEAKYSLSNDKLIRQQVEYKSMTIQVWGIDPSMHHLPSPVKVLDCDTISQVKEKALSTLYCWTPYSTRPTSEDFDLEWRSGLQGRLTLQDIDRITQVDGEWRRLNTLRDYSVSDGATFVLVPKQSIVFNNLDNSIISNRYENSSLKASPPTSPTSLSSSFTEQHHLLESGARSWHLFKWSDADGVERVNKLVSEIYLNRLLYTKGTLQQFVDDLFRGIFNHELSRHSPVLLPIKYMFDFLDDQALQHDIHDAEVVHTWKSNSLPLRFWVNLIKNPNFVFDVNKSNIVDSCLSVVAQTFMDSCSTSEQKLGKDSPASKLLYAKDIPRYKQLVSQYYSEMKKEAAVSDQDMNAMLAEESRLHGSEFNAEVALSQLYKYAEAYYEQLLQNLYEDESARSRKLGVRLEQVFMMMGGNEADRISSMNYRNSRYI